MLKGTLIGGSHSAGDTFHTNSGSGDVYAGSSEDLASGKTGSLSSFSLSGGGSSGRTSGDSYASGHGNSGETGAGLSYIRDNSSFDNGSDGNSARRGGGGFEGSALGEESSYGSGSNYTSSASENNRSSESSNLFSRLFNRNTSSADSGRGSAQATRSSVGTGSSGSSLALSGAGTGTNPGGISASELALLAREAKLAPTRVLQAAAMPQINPADLIGLSYEEILNYLESFIPPEVLEELERGLGEMPDLGAFEADFDEEMMKRLHELLELDWDHLFCFGTDNNDWELLQMLHDLSALDWDGYIKWAREFIAMCREQLVYMEMAPGARLLVQPIKEKLDFYEEGLNKVEPLMEKHREEIRVLIEKYEKRLEEALERLGEHFTVYRGKEPDYPWRDTPAYEDELSKKLEYHDYTVSSRPWTLGEAYTALGMVKHMPKTIMASAAGYEVGVSERLTNPEGPVQGAAANGVYPVVVIDSGSYHLEIGRPENMRDRFARVFAHELTHTLQNEEEIQRIMGERQKEDTAVYRYEEELRKQGRGWIQPEGKDYKIYVDLTTDPPTPASAITNPAGKDAEEHMAEMVALVITDPNGFFQNPDSDEYKVNKAMYEFIIEEYYDNVDFRELYKKCARNDKAE